MKFWRVLISHDGGKSWGTRIDGISVKSNAQKAKRSLEHQEPTSLGHDLQYKVVSVKETIKDCEK